jgi:hypothetical protein
MKKSLFWEKTLPLCLLVLLMVVLLAIVFTQGNNYGLTTDQDMHVTYGQTILKWYDTLGKNRSFLGFPVDDYEPQHGAIFDLVIAVAQKITHNTWNTEAVVIGLSGLLGVLGIALCGFALGGWWFALLAAVSLSLYPRFTGAIFNNPKDIPFTSATIFVLWMTLLLLKQWDQGRAYLRNSLLLALFLALAIAIRVTAIFWYGLLGLLVVGWWVINLRVVRERAARVAELKKQVLAGVIIGVVSYVGMLIMWPFVFISPFTNFFAAISVMSKYPWPGTVLFEGKSYLATDLPRSYAPVWLVIGSPPGLVLLAAAGLLIFCSWTWRKKILDSQMVVVLLALIIPLGVIVGLHSVIYNGLRQVLFVVPSLILLAVYGLLRALTFLYQKRQRLLFGILVLLTIGNFAWVAQEMLALRPYEYVYFSPLVGGVQGAYGQYEIDYWNTCQRGASVWLGEHYQQYIQSGRPTIQDSDIGFQYVTFLPANFQAVQDNPDFVIVPSPFLSSAQQAQEHYRLIYTESVESVPLCRVYVRTSSAS